jgi:hypothetical protein
LLFDLKNDPLERHDIASEHAEIVAKLENAYADWDSKNLEPGWVDPHPENVIKEEKKFRAIRNKSLKNKK